MQNVPSTFLFFSALVVTSTFSLKDMNFSQIVYNVCTERKKGAGKCHNKIIY